MNGPAHKRPIASEPVLSSAGKRPSARVGISRPLEETLYRSYPDCEPGWAFSGKAPFCAGRDHASRFAATADFSLSVSRRPEGVMLRRVNLNSSRFFFFCFMLCGRKNRGRG